MRAFFIKTLVILQIINYNKSVMPLLDYKCEKCGKIFSELVKNSDEEVFCPACKEQAKRIYFGKVTGSMGKKIGGCGGDCKNCPGCGR